MHWPAQVFVNLREGVPAKRHEAAGYLNDLVSGAKELSTKVNTQWSAMDRGVKSAFDSQAKISDYRARFEAAFPKHDDDLYNLGDALVTQIKNGLKVRGTQQLSNRISSDSLSYQYLQDATSGDLQQTVTILQSIEGW